jgi:hypothetical protein
MSVGRSFARSWGRGLAVLVMFVVGALLIWFALRRGGPLLSEVEREAPAAAASEAPVPVPAPVPARAIAVAQGGPTAVPADPYEGMYAGPGPDDPAGPGMLPHPITPEHVRIYRDVELLDSAWQALKRRDFERARSLLREHASEYAASGYDDINDGLTILTDCMEHPSASTRERARRFYEQRTASTTRRRIRKHCLEDESSGLAFAQK